MQLHIGGVRPLLAMIATMAACLRLEGFVIACPDCPTSRVVSALVCGDGVWRNLAFTMAPFFVFGIVAWRLHRIGRPPTRHAAGGTSKEEL
jgi:hypothetical protein